MSALPAAFAAAILLLAPACTAPRDPASASAQADSRQCFYAPNASDFIPVGDDSVIVRVGANDHYLLDLLSPCPNIDWSQRIAIRTRGSAWVCRDFDAELVVPGPAAPRLCPVGALRMLSDAEVEALRGR